MISIVIPLYNEAESLPELIEWIETVCTKNALASEIILIDDGSTDQSWAVTEALAKRYQNIRAVKFARNYGKAAGLQTGFNLAQGDVVITMDADLQDSPEEIPELVRMIREDGYDLVSGWKKKRYDPITKTLPTKLYNWATRKMSGIQLHDFNCGLKAYRAPVIKHIEVYGDMHRYIPVLAKRIGYGNIAEKVVEHRARKYGTTKYGISRFIRGPLDLLTVSFVSKYGKRPMHLFGQAGAIMFLIGFGVFAYIGGMKIYAIWHDYPAKNIADMSIFYVALTAMIIGTQLFIGGFLAELLRGVSPDRNKYVLDQEINISRKEPVYAPKL